MRNTTIAGWTVASAMFVPQTASADEAPVKKNQISLEQNTDCEVLFPQYCRDGKNQILKYRHLDSSGDWTLSVRKFGAQAHNDFLNRNVSTSATGSYGSVTGAATASTSVHGAWDLAVQGKAAALERNILVGEQSAVKLGVEVGYIKGQAASEIRADGAASLTVNRFSVSFNKSWSQSGLSAGESYFGNLNVGGVRDFRVSDHFVVTPNVALKVGVPEATYGGGVDVKYFSSPDGQMRSRPGESTVPTQGWTAYAGLHLTKVAYNAPWQKTKEWAGRRATQINNTLDAKVDALRGKAEGAISGVNGFADDLDRGAARLRDADPRLTNFANRIEGYADQVRSATGQASNDVKNYQAPPITGADVTNLLGVYDPTKHPTLALVVGAAVNVGNGASIGVDYSVNRARYDDGSGATRSYNVRRLGVVLNQSF
jgi:hypothetical protein